ncbi:MAG: MobC family plasmid mobilization relaxosome protein [Magnetococcales bacterium]|nr:MobC family plasmid mobilization relaxosome protein [Magnetococcales bacterium]
MSGYLRALAFGKDTPQPRGARRPVIEKEMLVRLLGELGKIGSNVNQIAHVANQGRDINFQVLEKLSADVAVIRQQVKAALGRDESPAVPPMMQEPESPATQSTTTPKHDAVSAPLETVVPPPDLTQKRSSFFGGLFKGPGS